MSLLNTVFGLAISDTGDVKHCPLAEMIAGGTQPPYKRLLEDNVQYYFDGINDLLSNPSED